MKKDGKKRLAPPAGRPGAVGSRLLGRLPAPAREMLRPALRLVLVMLAAVLALSVLNVFTANRAAARRLEKNEALLRCVLPEAAIFTETAFRDERAEMIYAGYTEPDDLTGGTVLAGYCVQVRAYGFGGPFELLVGVDLDGAVTGVKPVSHNETVGRGDVIGTADFLGQFGGRSGALAVGGDGNAVQAVSGATFSCRAVTEGVNEALAVAADVLAGGEEDVPGEEQPDVTPDAASPAEDADGDAAPADAAVPVAGKGDESLAGNP